MKNISVIAILLTIVLLCLENNMVKAQERVYVSTDKDVYVAGEDLWCSVYCIDAKTSQFSTESDLAYLQFLSKEGVVATHKVALINGRGCGLFQIPLDFGTGNYSIVSYTKRDGGNAITEFNGKIITIFNTASTKRVKDGVIVGNVVTGGSHIDKKGDILVEAGKAKDGKVRIRIENRSSELMRLNVSVYHADSLTNLSGSYNLTSLLDRTGAFEKVDETDYAGEVINVGVVAKDSSSCAGKFLYMSAMGSQGEVYISQIGEDGIASFKTGNIMGRRDLVFDVRESRIGVLEGVASQDTVRVYNVEVLEPVYNRMVKEIPQLVISREMDNALRERGRRMQISRRFMADTLMDLWLKKDNSFAGDTPPLVYNLDDYTRFPILEEILREYVKLARVRKVEGKTQIKIIWGAQGSSLALVDGVPVSDHSIILGLDQQLVKQIVVYPKRYQLNHFVYDGVVNFITYKGDMGGIRLPENVSIHSFDGASLPLAFTGTRAALDEDYPNFLSTIYWNPVVDIPAGETFEFDCILPLYSGNFKVVVEGLADGLHIERMQSGLHEIYTEILLHP